MLSKTSADPRRSISRVTQNALVTLSPKKNEKEEEEAARHLPPLLLSPSRTTRACEVVWHDAQEPHSSSFTPSPRAPPPRASDPHAPRHRSAEKQHLGLDSMGV